MDLNSLLTGAEAARAVDVSKQLINYWRRNGHLERQPCGRYRLGDVLKTEQAMRSSVQSHRRQLSSV
jgi:hypothetical protein